ncbi:MAG: roadblock/LC7 domain-containing protein [Gemmatimonadales bacterium]
MAGAATWSLDESDYQRITVHLNDLLKESNARCALLVDRAGQLLASVGEQLSFDPTAFASLTAADFSANDQLAQMIGEAEFASLFHQGEKESMYLADIARRVILVVLFDERTTVGMVRLRVKQTVNDLVNIFDEMFKRSAPGSSPAGGQKREGLLDGAEDEIDQLFGD